LPAPRGVNPERAAARQHPTREGKNLTGRVLAGVLGTIGKRSLGKAFAHSLKAIEARGDASVAGAS
jgi:hypothetical protein